LHVVKASGTLKVVLLAPKSTGIKAFHFYCAVPLPRRTLDSKERDLLGVGILDKREPNKLPHASCSVLTL